MSDIVDDWMGKHGVVLKQDAYKELKQQLAEAQRENEELRTKYDKLSKLNLAQHEMYEKDNNTLHDEIAALKAQSTEQPVAWILPSYLEFKGADSCLLFKEKQGVSIPLYTTPPTAEALLVSLGDWVHERMQQADADYHDHGDDTAEVYATLKMVLSKIESMMIESMPLIEGEK